MKLDDLQMANYNTTLMGVLDGALTYYDIGLSAPSVFGLSGHAFLINIHKQLCPSGPYCWNRAASLPLIRNMGLVMTDLGFYSQENRAADRAAVEEKVRAALDEGIACSVINLENQMITGYDEEGFSTAQPWAPNVNFPPAKLSFGSWQEFGDSFHANFYTLEKCEPAPHREAVLAALAYAIELHREPAEHSLPDYGVGPDAYDNWIAAAEECGAGHGNWWNGMVWSECRNMASGFFAELGDRYPAVAGRASELTAAYAEIGDLLGKASDKGLAAAPKVEVLKDAKSKEAAAIEEVAALAGELS